MKNWFVFLVMIFVLGLASCAKCNICETDGVEEDICTNSLLDRSKAKTNCVKEGGTWSQVERQ